MSSSNLISPDLSGKNLGGGFQGISPKQTIDNYKSSEQVMTRRVLSKSWNGAYATGTVNGQKRVTTPFRAVTNLGDFLGRQAYVCGGPNQVNASKPGWKGHIGSIISQCDGTGIPSSTCNVRFVPDSSDYITYKKQRAIGHTYNDNSMGGDQSNASYVPLMAVRRR
jgi:hypothetical protein